jgi:hypothetical protein
MTLDGKAKHMWSAEGISALDSKQIATLMTNAAERGAFDVVSMCEAALESRVRSGRRSMQVSEFHFVCADNRGVQELPTGRFRSGVWKVSDVHRERAVANGALLALHASKSQQSYRQGVIVGWEDGAR